MSLLENQKTMDEINEALGPSNSNYIAASVAIAQTTEEDFHSDLFWTVFGVPSKFS